MEVIKCKKNPCCLVFLCDFFCIIKIFPFLPTFQILSRWKLIFKEDLKLFDGNKMFAIFLIPI